MSLDVNTFQIQGEWLELTMVNGKILELKVLPTGRKEAMETIQLAKNLKSKLTEKDITIEDIEEEDIDTMYEKALELITDWNLVADGKPIPCTKENKLKHIEHLVGGKYWIPAPKTPNDEVPDDVPDVKKEKPVMIQMNLIQAVRNFSGDFSNFIKN